MPKKSGTLNLLILPLLIALFFSHGRTQIQTILWPELHGNNLLDSVIAKYKPSKTLGYDKARDTMYAVIDLKEGDSLTCVYTGYTIKLNLTLDPSTDAYNKGIDCEHSWPQSMGADSEPQRSNLHHLYPTWSNVNSSRGNDPFAEIPDANTDKWWRLNNSQTSIPTSNIDEYSEKESNATPTLFEPREDHKGNCARSMFYFYAMYSSAYYSKESDTSFWNIQKETLLTWNYYDTVDAREYTRTWKIATYQNDKPNPFVLDSTLARRIWFYKPTAIRPQEAPLVAQFRLFPCYPNPFNNATNLAFELPATCQVIITVFNLSGRLLEETQIGRLTAGYHTIPWRGDKYSSGVYLYRIQAGRQIRADKLLLMK